MFQTFPNYCTELWTCPIVNPNTNNEIQEQEILPGLHPCFHARRLRQSQSICMRRRGEALSLIHSLDHAQDPWTNIRCNLRPNLVF